MGITSEDVLVNASLQGEGRGGGEPNIATGAAAAVPARPFLVPKGALFLSLYRARTL